MGGPKPMPKLTLAPNLPDHLKQYLGKPADSPSVADFTSVELNEADSAAEPKHIRDKLLAFRTSYTQHWKSVLEAVNEMKLTS